MDDGFGHSYCRLQEAILIKEVNECVTPSRL